MNRRERQLSRALTRVAKRAHDLNREIHELRDHEFCLRREMEALERRVGRSGTQDEELSGPAADAGGMIGPVIHVYLVNGQDFYGIVNAMDDDNFSITLSNSAGKILIIPKRNILYYRMKY